MPVYCARLYLLRGHARIGVLCGLHNKGDKVVNNPLITGRAIGGRASMAKRTPEERKEGARKAALAKAELAKLPAATHQGDLAIGSALLKCYVLSNGTRVLTQEGFLTALGRAGKAKGGQGAAAIEEGVDRLPSFLAANNLKPFISADLAESTTPIIFRTPEGVKAYGYAASLLPKVCRVYLEARDEEKLLASQSHLAKSADILMRGLAEVGIIALVDEATGFQKDRAKDALAKILEAFVAKEIQPWVKTFPADYYEQLCRLRGLPYPPDRMHMPRYFGVLTNDIVYHRLAPGVLDALKKEAAKAEKRTRLHQHLTQSHGHIKLRELISSVVTIMKLSSDYGSFINSLNRIHHRYGDTIPLDLESPDR